MMIRSIAPKLTLLSLMILAQISCKPSSNSDTKNPAKARIDSLENEMRLSSEKDPAEPNRELAMYLAQAYQNYEADYPNDSLSAKYLFKAGQVIENVFDDRQRAGELYYSVFKKYPQSNWAPYALFMTGNLFHTMRDTAHAVEMLQFFMAKYPDHKLKTDAAALVQSLGSEPDTTSRPVKEMPINPL
jgi:hypothetical protein